MYTLRPATQTDYETLATLYQEERTLTEFEQMWQIVWYQVQNGRSAWLLVMQQQTLVGSGQLLFHQHKAELANLLISPPQRGLGLGTRLIGALEAIAQEKQATVLELRVLASNKLAQQLYARLDYGQTRSLTLPEGEIWVMQKQLTNIL